MIILIAESKTMTDCSSIVARPSYMNHTPLCEREADRIMEYLNGFDTGELAERIGISATLAQSMKKKIFEFPNKTTGEVSLKAFTGVVFKSLSPSSLSADALEAARKNLRIISSLYGWLRPDDIIKPYRLEFKGKTAPCGKSLQAFWRKNVTEALCNCMTQSGCHEILNLMPADASKCIDWKSLPKGTDVWKIDFVVLKEGKEKTPDAGKLKRLRGTILRQILTEGITDIYGITQIDSDMYVYDKIDCKNHSIRFISA